MKTLTLKEDQTLYEAVAAAAPDEPLVVERNGDPIYVLLPYHDYQAFHAWLEQRRALLPDNWFEQTPTEVVAGIKRQGAGVPNIRRATASLQELLENLPVDPNFDIARWQSEWAAIEAEIEANDSLPDD
jgi:hypothetical protein